MNRTALTRYLLAASLALNLGVVASLVIRTSAPRPANVPAQPQHLNLQDYLKLSTEQRAQWKQLEPAIAALQEAQQQRVIAQLLAERGVLDEQQRERLMDLLLSRYSQESTEEELLHRD